MADLYNPEKYPDPTAYKALKNIEKQERRKKNRLKKEQKKYGNKEIPDVSVDQHAIIGGDNKSASIAAASVIAKVTRDRMMYELDEKYPEYGFGKHKGYPTKMHLEAINKYGLIDGYRKSYGPVKEILERKI